MNTVNLIGRLTKDPEQQQTQSGHRVTSFSVAVDRNYKAHGDTRQSTDFFTVVAWNVTATFVAQHFKRGQRIGICKAANIPTKRATNALPSKWWPKACALPGMHQTGSRSRSSRRCRKSHRQFPRPSRHRHRQKLKVTFSFLDEPDDDFDFVL